jgi:hypothetical protein
MKKRGITALMTLMILGVTFIILILALIIYNLTFQEDVGGDLVGKGEQVTGHEGSDQNQGVPEQIPEQTAQQVPIIQYSSGITPLYVSVPITELPEEPDLTVGLLQTSYEYRIGQAFPDITFTVHVENNGGMDASPTTITIEIEGRQIQTINTPIIPSQTSYAAKTVYINSQADLRSVVINIDPGNLVEETDETNNEVRQNILI